MWIIGIIFLIAAIALLDCIRKPPKLKEGQKPMTKKQYIIGASICGLLSLLFFSMSGNNDEAKETTAPAKQEQVVAPKTEAPKETQKPEEKPKDLKSQIESIVVDKLGEKEREKPKIISLEVNDHLGTKKEGDKIVIMKLNASDNLTANMVKKGMWMHTQDILKELSTIEMIEEVVLFWHFPLIDQYGNEKEDTVMKIGFTRATLNKINWDKFLYNNIPNIADQYWQHPALPN